MHSCSNCCFTRSHPCLLCPPAVAAALRPFRPPALRPLHPPMAATAPRQLLPATGAPPLHAPVAGELQSPGVLRLRLLSNQRRWLRRWQLRYCPASPLTGVTLWRMAWRSSSPLQEFRAWSGGQGASLTLNTAWCAMRGFPDKAAMLSQNKHRSLFINHFLTNALGAVCQAAGKSHNPHLCAKTVCFSGSIAARLDELGLLKHFSEYAFLDDSA